MARAAALLAITTARLVATRLIAFLPGLAIAAFAIFCIVVTRTIALVGPLLVAALSAIVIAGTVLTLLASLLKTSTESLGTESALVVVVLLYSVCVVRSLSMNARTRRASYTAIA